MAKKKLIGEVVSNKMVKTIVVKVENVKLHSKFKTRYKRHKKYKVDDKEEKAKIGDKVVIEECRPLSKEKKWKLLNILSSEKELEEIKKID